MGTRIGKTPSSGNKKGCWFKAGIFLLPVSGFICALWSFVGEIAG